MSDEAEAGEKAGKGGSGKGLIIGLLVATLVAAGAGGGLGYMLGPEFKTAATGKEPEKAQEKAQDEAPAKTYAGDSLLLRMKPVTTNLRKPFKSWVRLEAAVIMRQMEEKAAEEMAAVLEQDVLAYLRTLTLKDLEGPANLAFLRDDLARRASLRSKGQVKEFLIVSLVVE